MHMCHVLRSLFLVSAASLTAAGEPSPDARSAKSVLRSRERSDNLLKTDAWRPWQAGFSREEGLFVCEIGADARIQRGVGQTVVLNQTTPEPIVATAFGKAEGVTGSPDNNYALYLDLVYADGTPLWGQAAPFDVGTHDWQRREVVVLPEKPVGQVSFYMLLRGHGGKAFFRDPTLQVIKAPKGACMFDGVPVIPHEPSVAGFQVRDVAADTDFFRIERRAAGLELECKQDKTGNAVFFDVTISDTTGNDRAVTLVYAVPIPTARCLWRDRRNWVFSLWSRYNPRKRWESLIQRRSRPAFLTSPPAMSWFWVRLLERARELFSSWQNWKSLKVRSSKAEISSLPA